MALPEAALPYSTPYDPAEDPPGSIDPLGTLATSERLAETLLRLNQRVVSTLLAEQNAALDLVFAHRGYSPENGRMAPEGSESDLLVDDHVRQTYLGAQPFSFARMRCARRCLAGDPMLPWPRAGLALAALASAQRARGS